MSGLTELQQQIVVDTLEGEEFECSALDYFTCGHCAELAEAINERLPWSEIVEVRVRYGSISRLIHAGVVIGGRVIDIQGLELTEVWLSKWSEPFSETEIAYRRGRCAFLAYGDANAAKVARQFASGILSCAEMCDELQVSLEGHLPDPGMAA